MIVLVQSELHFKATKSSRMRIYQAKAQIFALTYWTKNIQITSHIYLIFYWSAKNQMIFMTNLNGFQII